jgi:WD40 repeat protein
MGSSNGKIIVWPFDPSRPIKHRLPVSFMPTENVVSTGEIAVRRYACDADEPHVLPAHVGEITKIVFSDDGRWMLTASRDGPVLLWAGDSGRSPTVLQGGCSGIVVADFSPNEEWLATASLDGTRVWRTSSTSDPAVVLPPPWVHSNSATEVAFESNEGGRDRLLVQWWQDAAIQMTASTQLFGRVSNP